MEIVLKIELEDPTLSKPPPKKQAPVIPRSHRSYSRHSAHSSNASSGAMSLSPQLLNGHSSMILANHNKPTLMDSKSNPEFFSRDEPLQRSETPKLAHRSMPNSDEEEGDDDDDDDEIIELESNESSNSNSSENSKLYPVSTENVNYVARREEAKSPNGTTKRKRRSFISQFYGLNGSKSASNLPSNSTSTQTTNNKSSSPSPSFYIFRRKKQEDNDDEKGYNADTIPSSTISIDTNSVAKQHKYSDSALGIIKNGVVSMWGGGGSPRHRSQTSTTPKASSSHKNTNSVGGFPVM